MENRLHLEAESSTGRDTHSTGKAQMAVGDSERHPEEDTVEERQKQQASSMLFMSSYCITTVILQHRSISMNKN